MPRPYPIRWQCCGSLLLVYLIMSGRLRQGGYGLGPQVVAGVVTQVAGVVTQVTDERELT